MARPQYTKRELEHAFRFAWRARTGRHRVGMNGWKKNYDGPTDAWFDFLRYLRERRAERRAAIKERAKERLEREAQAGGNG